MLEALFHVYENLRAFFYRPQGAPEGDGLPIPPGNLLMQVAGSPDPKVYLHGGELAERAIRETLARNSFTPQGPVLDFGCGCGRVLRRFHNEAAWEMHGCDYNPDLAGWSRTNLTFARISANALLPPAPYRDGRFALVYAFSVLTHLPEVAQEKWMREFHRILAPGGLLLVSTHGDHYRARLNTNERRRYDTNELVVRSARSAGSNLCNAFHPPVYFRERLAAGFDVIEHTPRGALGNPEQDLWLLRKSGALG